MPLSDESERFIKGATYGTGPDHFRMDGHVEWLRAQLAAIEAAACADALGANQPLILDGSAPDAEPLRARVAALEGALKRIATFHQGAVTGEDEWGLSRRCVECSGPWRCPTRHTVDAALAPEEPR